MFPQLSSKHFQKNPKNVKKCQTYCQHIQKQCKNTSGRSLPEVFLNLLHPVQNFQSLLGIAFLNKLGLDEGITSWDLKNRIPRQKLPI